MKFTITQKDLDVSIKLREYSQLSECCIVTTAARRQFKDDSLISAGGTIMRCGESEVDLFEPNKVLLDVMNAFDDRCYEKINLPLTVKLTEV